MSGNIYAIEPQYASGFTAPASYASALIVQITNILAQYNNPTYNMTDDACETGLAVAAVNWAQGHINIVTSVQIYKNGSLFSTIPNTTVTSAPLPTGASTAANQSSEITQLTTIASNTTGASTAANQTAGNTSLTALAGTVSTNALINVGVQNFITYSPNITAGAYTSGMNVGGLLTLAAARITGGSGLVQSATVGWYDNIVAPVDIFLFDLVPTTPTDHTTWAMATADMTKVIGVIHLTDYSSGGTPSLGQGQNQTFAFKCTSGSQNIYAILVARGSFTPTATSNLVVRVNLIQN